MEEDNEMMAEENEPIFVPPQPVATPAEKSKEEIWNEDQREDVSDLTSLSEEDKAWQFSTAGLDELDDEEELDDLFEVTEEDIVGESSKPKPKFKLSAVKRIYRPMFPPPNNLGTMR